MDKQSIKNEINSLIQKIKEGSSSISNVDKISDIEMAVLISNADKLHQQLVILNYLNVSTPKQVVVADEVVKEKIIETKKEVEKPIEIKVPPIDLFGAELTVVPEKPKLEKKAIKKEEKTIVSKVQKPKIDNLNSAIGLNDKFQFANELFEGSMQEYNVAIHQLNSAETIESAMDYVENLHQLYNWDFENETVKRLLELVDRRYSG